MDETYEEIPENVVPVVFKEEEAAYLTGIIASYDLAKESVEGSYKGGEEKVYGLKEGAVGIPENANKNVPQDIIDFVNKEAEKVIKDEIKILRNEEEYNKLMKYIEQNKEVLEVIDFLIYDKILFLVNQFKKRLMHHACL